MSELLHRIWYEGAPVPVWLRALVPVYRALRALHLVPYRLGLRRPRRLPVPVVVVGNLTAGGSGKTPLVIALVEALRARGFRPGVVGRGYGGSERGPVLLDAGADPARFGDEPCLIRLHTGAPVAIGRKRADAAALLAGQGVDVVVTDDGLQNPSLARDVEICVIDGTRRLGNGLLLPAGPLREPSERLGRIGLRVCNGGVPAADEYPMTLEGTEAVALLTPSERVPLAAFAGRPVHAVAGIGHPERFFASLREHRIEVLPHAFPDHHAFTPADLHFGDGLPVLMTGKDAIKCGRFAEAGWWQVPVRARLPDAFFDRVVDRLRIIA